MACERQGSQEQQLLSEASEQRSHKNYVVKFVQPVILCYQCFRKIKKCCYKKCEQLKKLLFFSLFKNQKNDYNYETRCMLDIFFNNIDSQTIILYNFRNVRYLTPCFCFMSTVVGMSYYKIQTIQNHKKTSKYDKTHRH